MNYRHYGKVLEKMIKLTIDYPEGEEKEQLILLILNHMKKSYVQWNKDVEDPKIFQDLYDLSNHKIDKRNTDIKLTETKDLLRNNNNKQRNNQKKK